MVLDNQLGNSLLGKTISLVLNIPWLSVVLCLWLDSHEIALIRHNPVILWGMEKCDRGEKDEPGELVFFHQ